MSTRAEVHARVFSDGTFICRTDQVKRMDVHLPYLHVFDSPYDIPAFGQPSAIIPLGGEVVVTLLSEVRLPLSIDDVSVMDLHDHDCRILMYSINLSDLIPSTHIAHRLADGCEIHYTKSILTNVENLT